MLLYVEFQNKKAKEKTKDKAKAKRNHTEFTPPHTVEDKTSIDQDHGAHAMLHSRFHGYARDIIKLDTSPEAQDFGLGVQSVIEIVIREDLYHGVIRSLGNISDWPEDKIAGIELVGPFQS